MHIMNLFETDYNFNLSGLHVTLLVYQQQQKIESAVISLYQTLTWIF